jgi:hypothetical protein
MVIEFQQWQLYNWPELLFLFLKGMTGALAPFSYLVTHKTNVIVYIFYHFNLSAVVIKKQRFLL